MTPAASSTTSSSIISRLSNPSSVLKLRLAAAAVLTSTGLVWLSVCVTVHTSWPGLSAGSSLNREGFSASAGECHPVATIWRVGARPVQQRVLIIGARQPTNRPPGRTIVVRGSGSDSYEHLAQVSDEELVDRFNNGDNAACQVLFDRHGGTVYAVINSAGGDPEWTEDMVMEVFCEVLESLHSFSGRSSFATWLRQVAQNILYSELRKRAHRY